MVLAMIINCASYTAEISAAVCKCTIGQGTITALPIDCTSCISKAYISVFEYYVFEGDVFCIDVEDSGLSFCVKDVVIALNCHGIEWDGDSGGFIVGIVVLV